MRCKACDVVLTGKHTGKDPNGEFLDLCGRCRGPSDQIMSLSDLGCDLFEDREYVQGQLCNFIDKLT